MKMQTIRDELVPALIVAVVLGVYAYLVTQSLPVPDHLEVLVVAVVSFYFGGKATTVGRHNGVNSVTTAPHPPRSTDPDPSASPPS
jgi:hypothetical protein